MEPQPSTSAAAAKEVASTSGSPPPPVQQRQTEEQMAFYLKASVKQFQQLFGATCRVKLQRCQVPDATAPESDANVVNALALESNANEAVALAPASNVEVAVFADATPFPSEASADSRDVSKVKEEEDTSFCEEVPPSGSAHLRGARKLVDYSNSESDSSSDDIKVFPAPRAASSLSKRPVAKVGGKNNAAFRTRPAAQRRGGSRTAIKLEADSDSTTGNGSGSEDDDDVKDVRVPSAAPSSKKIGRWVLKRKLCFPCTVCKKAFSSKCYLKIHMNKHTGEKRYKCENCGRSFGYQGSLSKHKKKRDQRNGVCPQEKKKYDGSWRPKGSWTCEICRKEMKAPKNYIYHMRMHWGEKSFKCGECGKAFVTSGDLSQHSKIHSGVWQFSCIFCGKGFHQQPNYWSHLRIHTEEKPYFCKVEGCGTSCSQSGSLKRHRRRMHFKKY